MVKILTFCSSLHKKYAVNHQRRQEVPLSGQVSSLTDVNTWIPQDSILSLLLFLIYINIDLAGDLSNAKLSVDDTSLFFVAHNVNNSAGEVNNDFVKINCYQWKISLNPDPVKQAKEIIFIRKISKEDQSPLVVYEQ